MISQLLKLKAFSRLDGLTATLVKTESRRWYLQGKKGGGRQGREDKMHLTVELNILSDAYVTDNV